MIQKLTGPIPQATAEQKQRGPMFVILKCHILSDACRQVNMKPAQPWHHLHKI